MATLRSYRIFGIALFDLILSIIGTILIMLLFWRIHYRTLPVLNFVIAGALLAIPIGIFSHVLIGQNTKLNYVLGLSEKPHLDLSTDF